MNRRSVYGAVFVTVLLNLLGFGMLLPLLPTYARDFGASAAVVGVLIASYSAAQFISAPVLGRISDRVGRAPVVAACALVAAGGYLLFAATSSLTWIFVARILTGFAAGSIAAAQATIADVTAPTERGQGMAVVGAGIGLGIVLGPALTALSIPIGGTRAPFVIAAIAALANAIWAMLALPRTTGVTPPLLATLARVRRDPLLVLFFAVNFLVMVAFSQIESQLPLLTDHLLDFGPVENGYLFMYVGLVIVAFQLTGTRWLSRRLGDRRLIVIGLACFVLGSALAPFVTAWWQIALPAGLIAIGNATQAPSLLSAISGRVGADEQGAVLGASHSIGSSGRIIGPVLGGVLFGGTGPASPFLTAAAVFACLAAVMWVRRGVSAGS